MNERIRVIRSGALKGRDDRTVEMDGIIDHNVAPVALENLHE